MSLALIRGFRGSAGVTGQPWKSAAAGSRRNFMSSSPLSDTSVGKLDADLWKAYNTSLRKFIFQGKDLDKAKQAFYTAPIGAMAIPVGNNIPQPITNLGIYQTGDTLLDINNPIFVPGTGSYIQRQAR